jgi:hypothetical protein
MTESIDREKSSTFFLPTTVLQQDAVIIDEQESHIVLTVRLPIDWIRDNQTTLRALIEIATGKRMVPAEPDDDDAPAKAAEAADANGRAQVLGGRVS